MGGYRDGDGESGYEVEVWVVGNQPTLDRHGWHVCQCICESPSSHF